MTKRELLELCDEVAELDGPRGGYICKHVKRGWVVVDRDGREEAA